MQREKLKLDWQEVDLNKEMYLNTIGESTIPIELGEIIIAGKGIVGYNIHTASYIDEKKCWVFNKGNGFKLVSAYNKLYWSPVPDSHLFYKYHKNKAETKDDIFLAYSLPKLNQKSYVSTAKNNSIIYGPQGEGVAIDHEKNILLIYKSDVQLHFYEEEE
jgi:hypothetical protein